MYTPDFGAWDEWYSYSESVIVYLDLLQLLKTAIVLKSSDLIPTLSVHHFSASHQKQLGRT